MVFVTVRHEIAANGTPAHHRNPGHRLSRSAERPGRTGAGEPEPAQQRDHPRHHPDPVLLFRYSALTFNGHRIHYDRDYATSVEAYPGLVVHGPLLATLLVDHFLRAHPAARVSRFSFRAQRPLFDIAPFELCLAHTAEGAELWARNAAGEAAVTATLETA